MVAILGHVFSPKGLLRASGPDAAAFLQGQFSADLRPGAANASACVYGLWLDRKGKILADSYVLREGERSFLIVSHHAHSSAIKERLEAYIIMDEVEVEAVEDEARAAQLWLGRDAEGRLSQRDEWIRLPGCDVFAFWGKEGSGQVLELLALGGDADGRLGTAMASVGGEIEILDTKELAIKQLRTGAFQWGSDIMESDLPQEAGLERVAVSYDKGCYLGQEVMARIKAMGRVRRQLRRVRLSQMPAGELPQALVDEGGKRRGELRRAVADGGDVLGSAMIASGCESPLRLEGGADVVAEWSDKG